MPGDTHDSNVHISGGQVVAGNISGKDNTGVVSGPVSINSATEQSALIAAVAELRAELTALRTHLTATGGAGAEPADVDDVLDALNDPEPDLGRAESRWCRLRRRIPEGLLNLDTLTKIANLFEKIQGLTSS
ncbi:hypothetical protein [Nocardia sp. bgisy118]|uniref:hypothetical protein n=1 Tax=Nocardia sp. bgisy118 TaxID=3413786 RepID=UPI003F4A4168